MEGVTAVLLLLIGIVVIALGVILVGVLRILGDGEDAPDDALGICAWLAGQRVLFATATEWVVRLLDARARHSSPTSCGGWGASRWWMYPTSSTTTFDPEAAKLVFMLVSS